jgi:hypothetical protein
MHHSLTTILSCFLLQHVLQSLLASLTDLGPFLHVRFCTSVFVNHYMHTILVFVYQPQTAARHTQWRRYIHRHSFGSEQLDADDETHYNLVCVLRRSDFGWPPAPHWASISYVALSLSASTAARDQTNLVWDRIKGKSTGSDHRLA